METTNIKFFEDIPFDITDKISLAAATVDTCLNESTRCLEYQWDSIKNIRHNSSMLIAGLIALLVSFVGSFLSTIGMTPLLLSIVSLIGAVSSGIPIGILIYGIFYRTKLYHPGDAPSHYFRKEHMEWLKEMKEWDSDNYDEDKYLRLMLLRDHQLFIMENKKQKRAMVRYYRLALYLSFAVAILLLMLFLSFFLFI